MFVLPWLIDFLPLAFPGRRANRGRKVSARPRTFRLTLTVLEDRLAPAVLTVNSLMDGPLSSATATLSLREAVALVNSGGTASDASSNSLLSAKAGQIDTSTPFGNHDTIQFASSLFGTTPQVIVLQANALQFSQNVNLVGPGANLLAISGNNQSLVFAIDAGSAVNLVGLTVEDGAGAFTDGSGLGNGGGIVNYGTLTLNDSTVTGNTASNGGGLANYGTLTLNDSTVAGNTASNNDGGLVNEGTLTLNDSTVSGNTAVVGNGGIGNYGGTLTLNDSLVTGNSASGAGGIGSYGGTLTLVGSTVAGNSATFVGGILNTGMATLSDSTVSGNATVQGAGAGIANYAGTLSLEDSVVSGNSTAQGAGGGIANTGALTLNNSIVTDNSANDGGGLVNGGTLTLTNSTVSANTASNGGGLTNYGTLTLNDSTVSGNLANSNDGGLVNEGTLTLNDSTVSGNTAVVGNGGIGNYGGTLTLNDSSVTGNSASGAGGIGSYGGTLTLVGSTVAGNSATFVGGILNTGTATLSDSTVSGNATVQGAGSGIANYAGTLALADSVVTGNSTVQGASGGIANFATLTLNASTVSGNSALVGDGDLANAGTLTSNNATVPGSNNGNSVPMPTTNLTVAASSTETVAGDDGLATLPNHSASSTIAQTSIDGINNHGPQTATQTRNDALATASTPASFLVSGAFQEKDNLAQPLAVLANTTTRSAFAATVSNNNPDTVTEAFIDETGSLGRSEHSATVGSESELTGRTEISSSQELATRNPTVENANVPIFVCQNTVSDQEQRTAAGSRLTMGGKDEFGQPFLVPDTQEAADQESFAGNTVGAAPPLEVAAWLAPRGFSEEQGGTRAVALALAAVYLTHHGWDTPPRASARDPKKINQLLLL